MFACVAPNNTLACLLACLRAGAFVQGGCGNLSWVANNTSKLQLQHDPPHLECWTLISTNAYGQRNKVPQESVSPDVQTKVNGPRRLSRFMTCDASRVAHPVMHALIRLATAVASRCFMPCPLFVPCAFGCRQISSDLLQAFQEALGPQVQLPRALFTRAQLWGAALPLNTPNVDFILDPHSRVGVCGDWLGGSSLQVGVLRFTRMWPLGLSFRDTRGVGGSE